MSDDGLVLALCNGRESGVNDLLKNYGTFVYTIVNRILLNSTEAEEATQDIFMKVLKSINTFDKTSSFKAWLYSIAYRTAIDYTRKRKKGTITIEGLAVQDDHCADDVVKESEQKTQIFSLLQHLDEESRNIVTLYYLEEKNIKEIKIVTGMSESNIKTKLFRARKELSAHIHKYI
jgi:RNA polymerase sigma-70 factor (ECF subfamily)